MNKFNEQDIARIVGRSSTIFGAHKFGHGQRVLICQVFNQGTTREFYRACNLKGTDYWWVMPGDMELVQVGTRTSDRSAHVGRFVEYHETVPVQQSTHHALTF